MQNFEMATNATYLDHYLDKIHQIMSCLETLPVELQDNFNTMRDLDKTSLGEMKEVDALEQELFQNFHGFSEEEKEQKIESILKLYKKANNCFDDKVQLAVHTYEMVDKHIRRLDSDLAKFEADLKDKAQSQMGSDSDSSPKKRGRKSSGKAEGKKGRRNAVSSDDDVPKASKKKSKAPALAALELPSLSLNITSPSDVLDMPVDPNEPTYCFCHQVSYGEMIGCDNTECPIEWFHFACVGLSSKPKGKWFCSRCSAERKKK